MKLQEQAKELSKTILHLLNLKELHSLVIENINSNEVYVEYNIKTSNLSSERKQDILLFLRSNNCGFIAINMYKESKHLSINFKLSENDCTYLENKIKIEKPGVYEREIKIGECYYVGGTKYAEQYSGNFNQMVSSKLLSIDTFINGSILKFEGIPEEINVLTRKSIQSDNFISNRVDYVIISDSRDSFRREFNQSIDFDKGLSLDFDISLEKLREDINSII